MSFASLRVRLLVAAAISIALALILAAAGLAWLFQRHVERWIDSGLEVELNQLVGGLRRSPDGHIEIGRMPPDPLFEQPLSGRYWQLVVGPDGEDVVQGPYGADAEGILCVDIVPQERPARGCGWETRWSAAWE